MPADETQKWNSPTGSPIASHVTDANKDAYCGNVSAALDALRWIVTNGVFDEKDTDTLTDKMNAIERALTQPVGKYIERMIEKGIEERALAQKQAVNAEIDLDNAREVFENWLTGNGNYPHLKHKSFGGQYLHEEAAMKWDGFKAGYYARAEQKGGNDAS